MTPDPDSLVLSLVLWIRILSIAIMRKKLKVYWNKICSTVQQKQGVYRQNSLRAGSQRKQQRDGLTQVNSSVQYILYSVHVVPYCACLAYSVVHSLHCTVHCTVHRAYCTAKYTT